MKVSNTPSLIDVRNSFKPFTCINSFKQPYDSDTIDIPTFQMKKLGM